MTTMTQTRFAEHMRVSRSWVTALKKAGRLVLTDDGLVEVEASEKLIAASNGAEERSTVVTKKLGDSRERKDAAEAMLKEIELAERMGLLVELDKVVPVIASAAITLRSRIESMPDILAPQLAALNDEQKIRAMLADQFEGLLTELAAGFEAAGKGGA
jgi:hypothetical protein